LPTDFFFQYLKPGNLTFTAFMHPVWHVPELLLHIVFYLDEDDLSRCYNVSHHFRKTLQNNLPPHLLPLPDSSPRFECKPLPDTVRTLAADIELQHKQWTSSPGLIDLGDYYFYWRDDALSTMLQHVKSQLHPFLRSNVIALTSGLASIAQGKMGVWVQTSCRKTDFVKLLENLEDTYLTQPPTNSVEVYCPTGGVWDVSNRSVRRREGPTWRCNFARIERKNGVLMSDVIDELRGVLVPGEGVDTMLLDWQFSQNGDVWKVA
jgi:hypothetical protein